LSQTAQTLNAGSDALAEPGFELWRAGFLKRSVWFVFRRRHYRRVERANRVYRALAPICKPGVAEAAAEKYYREHTGNEELPGIHDVILDHIRDERTVTETGGVTAGSSARVRRWELRGSYFEACNCEPVCPCRSIGGRPGGRSTEGLCQFALSWRIAEGYAPEVDLDGLAVVLAGFYFDDEARSPWRVVLYVDEQADPAQRRWLASIFLGRAGGTTLRNFAAAISEVHAVRPARIALSHTPGRWRIRANDWVTVKATQFVDADETVACGIPGFDHPGQEVRAELLQVEDASHRWTIRERCGFATDFAYRSDD
jgi:hypothetical protein